jgi:hypothetical protein
MLLCAWGQLREENERAAQQNAALAANVTQVRIVVRCMRTVCIPSMRACDRMYV